MGESNREREEEVKEDKVFPIPSNTFLNKEIPSIFTDESQEYLIGIANSFFQQKKYQETINICNKLLVENLNSIEALTLIAKAYWALRKTKESRLYLNKALEIEPRNYVIMKDIGNTYKAIGDYDTSRNYYLRALSLNDNYDQALAHLGEIEYKTGNILKALSLFIRTTKSNPEMASAWGYIGICYVELGKQKEAEISFRKNIELKSNNFKIHFQLGMVLLDLKKPKEAEIHIRKSTELNPNHFNSNLLLAIVLIEKNNHKEAEKYIRKAIDLKPDSELAHFNLGLIFKSFGKLKEAENSFCKAIRLKSDYAEAYSNLGNVLQELNRYTEAKKSIQKAIELKPSFHEALSNLGTIMNANNESKDAEIYLRKAIQIKPNYSPAYSTLSDILREAGDLDGWKKALKNALKYSPNNLAYNINYKLYISPIPYSQEQITLERDEYLKQILSIMKNNKLFLPTNYKIVTSCFYLAYHGREDDILILRKLANSLSKVIGITCTSFNKQKQIESHNKRNYIKLGICSDFLNKHSVNEFFGNIIKDLASSGIEIIIFRGPGSKFDEESRSLDSFVSKTIKLPDSHKNACDIILNQGVDILFYPEIGMSNYTYLLSLSRLALVQVNALGHSNSSGCPNIDYAILCDDYDTKDSEKHFSERVIRLSRLPVNYSNPKIKESNFKRSKLNLADGTFLIGLPHTPFKFHPDFDLILDKILQEIPNAYFYCAEGIEDFTTRALKERWSKRTKLILKRTIFYPRVNRNEFLNILKSLDIILAPFYYGMGNTYYQAMAVGTPVVAYIQNHYRTRHVFAGYRQMGIVDPPIAYSPEEYIEVCKKLALDKSYKKNIKNQIISKSKTYLFNDKDIHKEYVKFFTEALSAAKQSSFLDNHWSTISGNLQKQQKIN